MRKNKKGGGAYGRASCRGLKNSYLARHCHTSDYHIYCDIRCCAVLVVLENRTKSREKVVKTMKKKIVCPECESMQVRTTKEDRYCRKCGYRSENKKEFEKGGEKNDDRHGKSETERV